MGRMAAGALKGLEGGVRLGAVIGLLGGLYLKGVRARRENSPEHLAELLHRHILSVWPPTAPRSQLPHVPASASCLTRSRPSGRSLTAAVSRSPNPPAPR